MVDAAVLRSAEDRPARPGQSQGNDSFLGTEGSPGGSAKPGHAGRLHAERMSLTHPDFNEATWIKRLATALEQVAAEAEPSYSALPPEIPRSGRLEEYLSALHRGYRALAERAKHDPTASIQFKASRLRVETDPVDAIAILREHPLIAPGLRGSGKSEEVVFRILNGGGGGSLNLEGPCSISRKTFGQRRRRRGCASPAPLPGRRGEWDRPGLRDHGYSRFGREDALQPRRRRLPSSIRGRQSGVRPARRT